MNRSKYIALTKMRTIYGYFKKCKTQPKEKEKENNIINRIRKLHNNVFNLCHTTQSINHT